jgi:hypothetical protein
MAKVAQVRFLPFTESEPEIGMGFNSDTGVFLGTALNFPPPTEDPVDDGQVGVAEAIKIDSQEEIMESIGASFSGDGRYGLITASAKMDFARSSSFNSTSTFVLARSRVSNAIRRGHQFQVTDPANKLLVSNREDEFKSAFGDSFVRGIKTGGEFFAVMRVTSLHTETQQTLSATLAGAVNGIFAAGEFKAQFDEANRHDEKKSEFFVTFYQASGLGITASTTLSIDDILKRLKDLPSIVHDHPVGKEVEVATYDTVPIPLQTPEERTDFRLALDDADAKRLEFLQKKNDIEFAGSNSLFFVDLPPADRLQAASTTYTRALNAVMLHAMGLANGTITPPVFFDLAKANITLPTDIQLPFKRKSGAPPPPELVAVPDLTGKHVGFDDSFELANALGLGIHPRNTKSTNDNRRNFEIFAQDPPPSNGIPRVPRGTVIEVDFLSSAG